MDSTTLTAPEADSTLRAPRAAALRAVRAFTIAEITVVLVVVGLLGAISIPAYNSFVSRSHDAAASEVVREVLTQSQSLAASADRDEFSGSDLTDAVDALPDDEWDASAPGVRAGASVQFTPLLGGESTTFGELAVGVDADGDGVVAKMRSRSGACVSGTAPLRGPVTVEVNDSVGCSTTHTEPAGPAVGPGLELPECPSGPSLALADSSVTVSWTASPSPSLAGYDLYVDGADPPVTVGPSVTSHEFGGLNNGQTYTFSAVAFDSEGQRSAACALGAGAPSLAPPPAPAAPVLCQGGAPVCVEGDAQVTVHWVTPPSETYASFEVYRDGTLVNTQPASDPRTFTDTGLTNGVTYQYWVIGISPEAVPSPASNVVPLTPVDPAPGGPAGLDAPLVTVAAIEERPTATLTVSWTAVAGADGYRVHIGSTANPVVATVPAGSPRTLELPDLDWGTTYTIWVVAYDASTSADAAGNGLTVPAPPGAPSLAIVGAPNYNTVRLTWASRPSATSYRVFNGDASTLFASPSGTTWDHGGRSYTSSYTYRLRACNASGCSNLGPTSTISTPRVPDAPNVSCAARNGLLPGDMTGCDRYRQLSVRWTNPANNGAPITEYQVRRQRQGSATWTGWTDVGLPATIGGYRNIRVGTAYQSGDSPMSYYDAFRMTTGDAGRTWNVQVRACNVVGCGNPDTVSATPFSNDLYPNNVFYGQEELKRGQQLKSAARLNTIYGVYGQGLLVLGTEGNLSQWFRYRNFDGSWGAWAHVWNSGTSSSDPSQSLRVAEGGPGQFSGLLLGTNSTLQWGIGGTGCSPFLPNTRSFVFHTGITVVLVETHHRRNYPTRGGTYSSGAPYTGSDASYWWTYATNTNYYAGCGAQHIQPDNGGIQPVP